MGRVAQAFDPARITALGCPVLRVFAKGRESEMPRPSGLDDVSTTKSNSTRSIAAHLFAKLGQALAKSARVGHPQWVYAPLNAHRDAAPGVASANA
jgi:hypothetical protein